MMVFYQFSILHHEYIIFCFIPHVKFFPSTTFLPFFFSFSPPFFPLVHVCLTSPPSPCYPKRAHPKKKAMTAKLPLPSLLQQAFFFGLQQEGIALCFGLATTRKVTTELPSPFVLGLLQQIR
jgi:hypothetical protein